MPKSWDMFGFLGSKYVDSSSFVASLVQVDHRGKLKSIGFGTGAGDYKFSSSPPSRVTPGGRLSINCVNDLA